MGPGEGAFVFCPCYRITKAPVKSRGFCFGGRSSFAMAFGKISFPQVLKIAMRRFGRCRPLYMGAYMPTKKKVAGKKPAAKRSPTWAVRELKAIAELYDYGRCTPELRDRMQEEVWKEMERGR